jgi:hypothetical protein
MMDVDGSVPEDYACIRCFELRRRWSMQMEPVPDLDDDSAV